ncbi:hypothetical protein Lalb_Chr23g0275301 [Lupinus albus]|uniref:Uncharacterized protein n=1 Tax=Lupinus albus TaxID=3870 RepID=A0A6A4NJ99_LUPAL|nr:hypothetical protein Lalb_Chr23g0275301 [Lupinus albus]
MPKRNVAALERSSLVSLDQKLALANICSHGNLFFYSFFTNFVSLSNKLH